MGAGLLDKQIKTVRTRFIGRKNFVDERKEYALLPFRYTRIPNIPGQILITSVVGEYMFLREDEFTSLVDGTLLSEGDLYRALRTRQLLCDNERGPLLRGLAAQHRTRKAFAVERRAVWNEDRIVVEHRFRHKNGEYRWLRRHLERVNGSNKDMSEWHGCVFDITDLKQAQARLTNYLEAAPDPVVTTSESGDIVIVNAQAERLLATRKKSCWDGTFIR